MVILLDSVLFVLYEFAEEHNLERKDALLPHDQILIQKAIKLTHPFVPYPICVLWHKVECWNDRGLNLSLASTAHHCAITANMIGECFLYSVIYEYYQ